MLIILLFLPALLLMLFRPLVLLSPPLNGIRNFLLTLFSGLLALILPLILPLNLLSLQLSTISLLRWRSSRADAVGAKAFTRIDAVFDALSSPDISHQISYHILSSTLPSYLMHTLRVQASRSSHACSYCYAASISQSLPHILPILQMAAPDYIVSFTHSDLDLELDDPVVHPMFLEIASTIDRLRILQRAFPTSSHSNSSSLPISIDNVLPKCSPLSDVSDPISFSQYLYHFSDISSPYLSEYIRLRGRSKHNAHLHKCFTSLLNRVRHFDWLSSIDWLSSLDSSAPLRYCVRVRCQGNEASIPLTCPPIDRRYHLSNPQWDLMAQRHAGLVDASSSLASSSSFHPVSQCHIVQLAHFVPLGIAASAHRIICRDYDPKHTHGTGTCSLW
eukprot:g48337.t1